MKIIAKTFLFAAAVASALVAPLAQAAVETGKAAPDFSLTDTAGKTHKLSDYKGKTVVIEWVNSGCPVVQRHYNSGNMQATQKAATADGVVWLQVNTSYKGAQGNMTADEANSWLKKQGAATTAYLQDGGKIGRLYGAKTTPHMYVVDKAGVLAYQGAIDDKPNAREADTQKSLNYVNAALASIKAGKPVEKANTQAYGCGIKYGNDS